MMAGETAALNDMPEHVRRLVGNYEGLRGYHLLAGSPKHGPAHARDQDSTYGGAGSTEQDPAYG